MLSIFIWVHILCMSAFFSKIFTLFISNCIFKKRMHECVWWRKGIAEHVHGGILQGLFWPWECRDKPGQDFSDIRDSFILMVYWYIFGKCSKLWRSLIWRPLRKSLIFRKLQEIFPLETDVLTGQTSSFPTPATAVRRYIGKERQATRGQKITEEVPAFSCPPGPLCPHSIQKYLYHQRQ